MQNCIVAQCIILRRNKGKDKEKLTKSLPPDMGAVTTRAGTLAGKPTLLITEESSPNRNISRIIESNATENSPKMFRGVKGYKVSKMVMRLRSKEDFLR